MKQEHVNYCLGSNKLTMSITLTKPSSGPAIIKLDSCSTQLCMKFQLLRNNKMLEKKYFLLIQTVRCCIYAANKMLKYQRLSKSMIIVMRS